MLSLALCPDFVFVSFDECTQLFVSLQETKGDENSTLDAYNILKYCTVKVSVNRTTRKKNRHGKIDTVFLCFPSAAAN